MLIALATGLIGISFSGTPYMAAGAAATFGLDWGVLAINMVAWIIVSYAVLFAYERIRG